MHPSSLNVFPSTFIGLPKSDQKKIKKNIEDYTAEEIASIVCESLNIPLELIYTPTRKREVSEARTIVIGLILRNNPTYGLKRLGKVFGRDHSTIIYQKDLFEDLYEKNKVFTEKVERVLIDL